jgi:hypothetical protein
VEGDVDLAAGVRDALSDRHALWAFVRAFAAGWVRPLRPGDGLDDGELAEVRVRLRTRYPGIGGLPAALEETYALLGHRSDLTSNQDRLLTGRQLMLDDSGQVLVVRRECQGSAEWGIRTRDLDQDDPPVVMHIAGNPQGWIPYAPRWSVACLEMILFEATCGGELAWNTELDDDALAIIDAGFQRLPLPELPHWTLPQVRWFIGPDMLLRDEAQTWLWALGRTPEALNSLQAALHSLDSPDSPDSRRTTRRLGR